MNHTKGKWEIHKEVLNSPQPVYIYGGPDCTHVCGFRELNLKRTPKEILEKQQADAILIAAAPDLLAACKKITERMIKYNPPDNPKATRYVLPNMGEIEQLQAAIAKAENKKS